MYRKILIVTLSVLVGVLVIAGVASVIVAQATVTASRQAASSSSAPVHNSAKPSPRPSTVKSSPPDRTPKKVPAQESTRKVAPTVSPATVEALPQVQPDLATRPTIPNEAPQPAAVPVAQCPTGVITAGVTQVEFGVPSYEGSTYVGLTAKGTINNRTSAVITFYDRGTPDLEGLDSRGSTTFFEQFGDYSYVPPAGEPRPSQLILHPGQSMNYQVTREYVHVDSILATNFWFTALDTNSFSVSYDDEEARIGCGDPKVVANESGQSIPNTYRPAVQ